MVSVAPSIENTQMTRVTVYGDSCLVAYHVLVHTLTENEYYTDEPTADIAIILGDDWLETMREEFNGTFVLLSNVAGVILEGNTCNSSTTSMHFGDFSYQFLCGKYEPLFAALRIEMPKLAALYDDFTLLGIYAKFGELTVEEAAAKLLALNSHHERAELSLRGRHAQDLRRIELHNRWTSNHKQDGVARYIQHPGVMVDFIGELGLLTNVEDASPSKKTDYVIVWRKVGAYYEIILYSLSETAKNPIIGLQKTLVRKSLILNRIQEQGNRYIIMEYKIDKLSDLISQ